MKKTERETELKNRKR